MFQEISQIPATGEYGHLLSLLLFSPMLGIVALCFVAPGKEAMARSVALASSIITFLLSLQVLRVFNHGAEMQFLENLPWYSSLGVRYVLGIDGISLALVLLTTFLGVLVMIASPSIHKKTRAYLGCMLFLQIGMLGTFLALDGLVFYVFWELMLIPMYLLIGVWGGQRRIYAAVKFVLYTAAGSILMLVAMLYLAYLHFQQFGTFSFYFGDWTHLQFTLAEELWLFAAFAFAFAIKIPLFPLHTWLPDAHVEAPTGGSVILAGVLLKMGLYGLIRICFPVFPLATQLYSPIFAVLGVVGIVFGALVAWVQTDMKKLVAYSSVSHLGFCVLGYAALNPYGFDGAVMQMLNHGVSTAALFFLVGVLYDRRHTRLIADYGGLAARTPAFCFCFLVFTLSSIGLPLTNGFVGEFLILMGGFRYNAILGGVAVSGVVLGAIYMLSLYRRISFGKLENPENMQLADLFMREKLVFAPLMAMVFFLGIYPQPVLDLIRPVSQQMFETLARSNVHDSKKVRNAVMPTAAVDVPVPVENSEKRI